jgi:hypothetical protein
MNNSQKLKFVFLGALLGFVLGYLVAQNMQRNIDAERINACEAKFASMTVLYEFDPTPGLPILGGALSIAPGSAANPVGSVRPKWLVPAKIIPTVAPGVVGASFSYFDPQTRKLDGPYVPNPAR